MIEGARGLGTEPSRRRKVLVKKPFETRVEGSGRQKLHTRRRVEQSGKRTLERNRPVLEKFGWLRKLTFVD